MKNPFKAKLTKKKLINFIKYLKALSKYWYLVMIELLLIFINVSELLGLKTYKAMVINDNDMIAYMIIYLMLWFMMYKLDKFIGKKVGEKIESNNNQSKSYIKK